MLQRLLNIFKFKISDQVLLSLSALLFLLKVILDLSLFLFSEYNTYVSISAKMVISFLTSLPLGFYFFRNFVSKLNNSSEVGFQSFYDEIKSINFFLIFIFLSKLVVPNSIEFRGNVSNFLSLIYINLFAIIIVFTGFKLLHFLNKWLWIKRHKKTKSQLLFFRILFFIFLIGELPLIYLQKQIPDLGGNLFITIPINLLHIVLMIGMFISLSKNNWIALLTKKEKFFLILQNIVFLVCSILILTSFWDNQNGNRFYFSLLLFFGSQSIFVVPILLGIGFNARTMFSAVVSLPTTEIVGKKSNELKLLTYLNKIVSQSIDFERLINSATSIAFESINATGSWTEIYNDDGSVDIISEQNVNKKYLDVLHKNPNFSNIFKNIDDYLLIESIPDTKKEDNNIGLIDFASAIIAIPIKDGNKRLGSLVVICIDEYGFDSEDLNIIQAIGNNVNIALENAKLLNESLEKERYKKELNIAHSITEKLIPHNVCCIENYDLSSFLLSADEVGGDYYDIVQLKDGKNCLLIGDISGKGMSAAFYMALLKGVVLSTVKTVDNPKDLLVKINEALFSNMDKQMYLTLSALKIEDDFGKLSFARAGHLPLIIKSGEVIELYKPKGLGIGLAKTGFFESNLEQMDIQLKNNDYCIMFTDGVSDSLDSDDDDDIEYKNLKQILYNSVYNNTGELLSNMDITLKNSKKFKNQRDDMTLLVLRYNKMREV